MVNQIILEYLRVNRGNYKIGDLKAKIIASGYTQKDIDEAMAELNKQNNGVAPEVNTTIKKINDTNLQIGENVEASDISIKPIVLKKSHKWIWLIVVFVLLAIASGVAGWWYFFR